MPGWNQEGCVRKNIQYETSGKSNVQIINAPLRWPPNESSWKKNNILKLFQFVFWLLAVLAFWKDFTLSLL